MDRRGDGTVGAPTVLIVVSSPVRWLESLLRTEGAQHTAVSRDAELTQLEDVTARFATVAWAVSVAAMLRLLVHYPISQQGGVAVAVALVVSAAMFVMVMYRRIAGRRPLRRSVRTVAARL